ncbi:MAG: precorrin-8X methylmutase [Actinobacteria bacterium]|nr:precorrin-8X methylmutase [Actinomycetota bacterium]
MNQLDEREPHPIEVESYEIISDLVDLTKFTSKTRSIVQRVIHATADLDYATTMLLTDTAVEAGLEAISKGAPIICDVTMLMSGITAYPATCYLPKLAEHRNTTTTDPSSSASSQINSHIKQIKSIKSSSRRTKPNGKSAARSRTGDGPTPFSHGPDLSRETIPTRSARAMRLAAAEHPEGAIIAVGCAPTALFEILRLVEEGSLRPALVIGMPVGFVGASDAKEYLAAVLPKTSITNSGPKGGSAATAAAVNALVGLGRTTENANHYRHS